MTDETAEREALIRALTYTGGNRHRAAQLLGITKTALFRKMRDHALQDLRFPPLAGGPIKITSRVIASVDTPTAEVSAELRETRARLEAAAREADEKLRDALTKALRSVKSTEHQGSTSHLAKRLATPPGSRLRHWLRPLVSRRFYDEVVSQTIADACDEWLEAHTRDEVRAARLIHLRLFVQLALVLGRGFLGGIVRSAIGILKSG